MSGAYQVQIYLGEVDDRIGPDLTEQARAVTLERALRQVLLRIQPQPVFPDLGVYAEVKHIESGTTELFEDYPIPIDPNKVAAHPELYALGANKRVPFGELRYAQALSPSASVESNQEARRVDRVIQCCVDAYYGVPFDTVPFAFWDPAGIDVATGETRYLASVDLPDDHPDRIHGFSFLVDLLDLEIRKSATGRFYVYSERERA